MKKILAGILSIIFTIAMVSCGNSEKKLTKSKGEEVKAYTAALDDEHTGGGADSSENPDDNSQIESEATSASKGELKSIIESTSKKSVVELFYDDYDNDGLYEAFAIVGQKSDEPNCGLAEQIYFIDSSKELTNLSANYINNDCNNYANYSNAKISSLDKKYFSVSINYGGSSSVAYVYGVKNQEAYKLKISKQIETFNVDTGTISSFDNGYHEWDNIPLTYNRDEGEFYISGKEPNNNSNSSNSANGFPEKITNSNLNELGRCMYVYTYNGNMVAGNVDLKIAQDIGEVCLIDFEDDNTIWYGNIQGYTGKDGSDDITIDQYGFIQNKPLIKSSTDGITISTRDKTYEMKIVFYDNKTGLVQLSDGSNTVSLMPESKITRITKATDGSHNYIKIN